MWTEEQAKAKWCPFARVGFDNDLGRPSLSPAVNRLQKADGLKVVGPCIASQCMAWRWNEEPVEIKRTHSNTENEPDKPEGDGWQRQGESQVRGKLAWQEWWRHMPNRQGRCGLAGPADLTLNTEPDK